MAAPLPIPAWRVNCADQNRTGLIAQIESTAQGSVGSFVRGDGNERSFIGLVPALRTDSRLPWDFADLSGCTLEIGLGAIDQAPTGGTFALSYAADSTGLTVLGYGISATALQTALNANPGLSSGGASVTVTQEGRSYLISWGQVGVRSLLVADPTLLFPECSVTVSRVQTGTGSLAEKQVVTVKQRPYAYTGGAVSDTAIFTPLGSAAAAVTSLQTGSSTQPSIQRIALSPKPIGGSFTLAFGKPEVTTVQCGANGNAAKQVALVATVADSAGSLGGKYFDIADGTGPVRFWYSHNSGVAPVLPTGGRLVAISTISNNDTAATVATKTATAVDADAQFVATATSNVVTSTDAAYGSRAASAAGTSGFTTSDFTAGNYGDLHAKYFELQDSFGLVAVAMRGISTYHTATGSTATRTIWVTLAPGDTATAVATALAAALAADNSFLGTSSTDTLTVTAETNGTRGDAAAGTSGFAVALTSRGVTVSRAFAFDVGLAELQSAFGTLFSVASSGSYSWDVSFVENGAQSLITAGVTNLTVEQGYIFAFDLNTYQTYLAFAGTSDDTIDATLEISLTRSGKKPLTVLQFDTTVARDVIDLSTLASTPSATNQSGVVNGSSFGLTGLAGGGSTNLDGVTTVGLSSAMWCVNDATYLFGIWELTAGTTAENVANGILHPDDYNVSTNAKIWLRRF